MSKRWIFGDRPVGAVTLVEPPLSGAYARKARVAFFVSGSVSAAVSASVLGVWLVLPLAVLAGVAAGAVVGLLVGSVVRVWPVLRWLWWWSAEITAAGLLVVGLPALAQATHPAVMASLVALAAGVVGLVRPVRRRVVAWGWCVVVRHRLRLCFGEFVRSASRLGPGSLPLILWARPTRAGERVWVWLRPGLSVAELEAKADKIAVGCWASEARVVRASTRFAALVRVDIARRDPLTEVVASPLVDLVPPQRVPLPVDPAAVEPVGLNLADVPEPAAPEPVRVRR